MSYLNAPRLCFFGQFQADPSTLNNDACNYNPADQNPDPSWNPDGSHKFSITGCTVTGLTMADGSSGAGDPLLGSPVASIDTPNPAKIVDLDTEQQMVSMIFGMNMQVGNAAAGSFTGAFEPVCFNDIAFGIVSGGQGDGSASAYYQSVLTNVQWSASVASPFLQALQAASPNGLSIKFVVSAFDSNSTVGGQPNPHFTFGQVVGSIGPLGASEPPNYVVGRLLRPTPTGANAPFNYGWALVDAGANTVTFDLSNSLPVPWPGTTPPDLGTLTAVVLPAGTAFPAGTAAAPTQLGTIDYSGPAYQSNGYIQVFPAAPAVIAQIQNGAELAILQASGAADSVVLQENQTCAYVCATPFVFRMNPGDVAPVQVMVVQNGLPAPGQAVSLAPNNAGFQRAVCKGADLKLGIPATALSYPASVTTGPDGTASFNLTASDPGNPRTYLNGQLYGVGFTTALDNNPDPNWFLSVDIYSSATIPANPTWVTDVLPILQPFAKLYPYMDNIIQLDDYDAVQAAAPQIAKVLMLPIGSPNHMPVTRDMSADQRNTILKWIKNGTPQG